VNPADVATGRDLSPAQVDRRRRILDAAVELARTGGWDGVQMREVARDSGVALGTLYRYFPSKEYLLVSLMHEQVTGLAERLAVRPPEGTDPVERVSDVLRRANRALLREPSVTETLIRALVTGGPAVAPAVAGVRDLMRRIITDALGLGTPQGEHIDPQEAIDLLTDVWLASLVSWITGIEPPERLVEKLSGAARFLFGAGPDEA
jgi:AcrR family transcriptional regulator